MDQNSIEGGESSNEVIEDNLLEPLSEVSFSEREKTFHAKDSDSSLPDNHAKVLHLQRVQRAGDSSNDTVKSSASKKRSKSQSGENEETVSFSLESIIRRGLNEQKLQTNFNNSFKFDSKSDSYQSSGEQDDVSQNQLMEMKNGTVNGNETGESAPVKRKPGRPRLTEEQKLQRAAEKEELRSQNSSMLNTSSVPTHVDNLMAMGHSIFSEFAPKKRGRRPKAQVFDHFANVNTSLDSNHDSQDDLQGNESANEIPIKKKRGRKPKSFYLLNNSNTHNESTRSDGQAANTSAPPLVREPKKRGRKPKYLDNYYVKLEQPAYESLKENQNITQNGSPDQELSLPIKKKPGRKPKSFYLQQAAERLNETAPAVLGGQSASEPMQMSTGNTSLLSGILPEYKKRGRKPKAYYEQLALLERQQNKSSDPSQLTDDPTMNETQSTLDSSALSMTMNDSLADEPPAKKKRGRKPKSYYLELQRQQMLADQSTSDVQMAHVTANTEITSSRSDSFVAANGRQASTETSSYLTAKRIPKPSLKQYIPNRRPYIKRLPIYRRPGIEMPSAGYVMPKKRGRKPKNYQAYAENQNSTMEEYELGASVSTQQVERSSISENVSSIDAFKTLEERNRVLLDLYEKRGDEVRMLKQRMSNLINDKVDQETKENGINSFSWTNAELCKAFSLQRLSTPLFTYLRDKFLIPLPSEDDVRKFVRNIQLVRGMQTTMLQILEYDGQIYKDHERVTVLQISCIKTAELFEYDESLDLIWGPHKYITMIVARGLYYDWSQLVYLNFDTRVTKQDLNCVIEALHKISFSVSAVACNFEEAKTDVFSELQVCYGKGFFPHSITTEKIFCFYYLDDMLQATNTHFVAGHLVLDDGPQSVQRANTPQPINKQAIMQAIQKNYRKIPIQKELLEWADNDANNVNAIHTFFSQYTMNLLRITSPDERQAKNTVEFISIIKSFADMMSRTKIAESDVDTINFDTYLDFQNKKLDKIHARLFKLQCSNQHDATSKKFREAMMMSIVSLKMLRKSVMSKYKYPTFSTAAITNELIKSKFNEIIVKYNFKRTLPPMLVFRILKDIFFGENCAIKSEPTIKFFYNGALTAAEVNGRNESYYVMTLIQWLCEKFANKHPNAVDPKDLKRKLKKVEENFCAIQNPNFRVCENVVTKMTKELMSNAFGPSMNDIIRSFVVQRHLLRIKYFNENRITRIPMPVQMTITLEE